jgi:hypothetical protein
MALMLVIGALGGLAGCTTQHEVQYSISNPPCDFARMTRSLDQFSAQNGLRSAPPNPQPYILGGFWAPNIRYVDASRTHIELIALNLTNGIQVRLLEERLFNASSTGRFRELDSALQDTFTREFGAAVERHENTYGGW